MGSIKKLYTLSKIKQYGTETNQSLYNLCHIDDTTRHKIFISQVFSYWYIVKLSHLQNADLKSAFKTRYTVCVCVVTCGFPNLMHRTGVGTFIDEHAIFFFNEREYNNK